MYYAHRINLSQEKGNVNLRLTYLQVLLDPARKQLFIIILKSILTQLKCPTSPNLRSTFLIFKYRSYLLNIPLNSPPLPFYFFFKHKSCTVHSTCRFCCQLPPCSYSCLSQSRHYVSSWKAKLVKQHPLICGVLNL